GAVDASRSGIASAVNNAVSRIAGLVAIALAGSVGGATLDAVNFHQIVGAAALAVAVGGAVSAIGIRNPHGVADLPPVSHPAFVASQQAARRVRSGGAIINCSTSVARLQFPTYAGYAASKGAVNAMTLVLARELRGKDITVNAVAPGPTATDLFLDGKSDEAV